jgi:hypothetical protein
MSVFGLRTSVVLISLSHSWHISVLCKYYVTTKTKQKQTPLSESASELYRLATAVLRNNIIFFYFFSFWDCACFIKVIRKHSPSQHLFKAFIVFLPRPLHVSDFTGHHHVEHNIIYKEVSILTMDPLSVVQIVLCALFDKCCRRLFKCDREVSTSVCNHFVFLILDVESVASKY